jgi:methylated-DNA-[protein]-cysteine S-methyltransferase
MKEIIVHRFISPYGELLLGSYQDRLCLCDWAYRKMRQAIDSRITEVLGASYCEGESEIIAITKQQLSEYFRRERKEIQHSDPDGGVGLFRSRWEQLLQIPYGQTRTYNGSGSPARKSESHQAVAAANGANALYNPVALPQGDWIEGRIDGLSPPAD